MNVGELFVTLGIKGADQAGKAVEGVRKNLGEVKSMSLEAKAAIVGVVYGLERLMSSSAKSGTDLANFNALTGLSAKQLQQWQYAARQAGVSSEEFTGSIKGVQQSMTNMLLGKGAPEGFAMVANKVGLDPKRARDTFYVMEQLQKFAKTVPPDVANAMIKSFGVSEGTISAMRRNVFTPDMFKKAPTYSDKEVNQLAKVDVAWSNLGNKIQMAMGHLTSKHGLQLVNDISKLTTEVLKMVDAFTMLAEKIKLFEKVGKIFEGWSSIFKGITEIASGNVTTSDVMAGAKGFFSGIYDEVNGLQHDFLSNDKAKPGKSIVPKVNAPSNNKQQNIEINQNLNFNHDGKDHKKTGDSVHKSVKDAFRQMSAQNQGS